MEMTLTEVQYEVAFKLSLAHGHEWAEAAVTDHWTPHFYAGLCSIGEVILHTISRRKRLSIPGIAAPEVGPSGEALHVTTTGRLEWKVTREGNVFLRVNRPAGPILQVERVDGRWRVVRLSLSVPLYQRHVDAIIPALRALDAPREVLDKVRSLVQEEEGEG